MTEGVLNLHYHNGESAGSVKVKLKQDVPEEMMELLVTNIKDVVEKWQDKVIMYRKLNQTKLNDHELRKY